MNRGLLLMYLRTATASFNQRNRIVNKELILVFERQVLALTEEKI